MVLRSDWNGGGCIPESANRNDDDDGNINGPHGAPVWRQQLGFDKPERDVPHVPREEFAKQVFRLQETIVPIIVNLSGADTPPQWSQDPNRPGASGSTYRPKLRRNPRCSPTA